MNTIINKDISINIDMNTAYKLYDVLLANWRATQWADADMNRLMSLVWNSMK